MIRIEKPPHGPARLQAGIALTHRYCQAFDRDPEAHQKGASTFAFDRKIYGHASIKKALADAQHGKCCYCEGRFSAYAPGDVEHFRPKQCVQQGRSDPLEYPGYYWLGYSWSNLYFSCPNCNRSAKKSLFPLVDRSARARDHAHNLSAEQPLILDPGGPDEPRDHIRFHQEVPVGVTAQGRATIDVVNLARLQLGDDRRAHLKQLKMLKGIVDTCSVDPRPEVQQVVADAQAELLRAIAPDAIFSAMAADLLSAT